MKWINHKLLSGSFAFAMTGDFLLASAVAVGSIIPDAVEGMPTENNYEKWRKRHRKKSHILGKYILVLSLYLIFYSKIMSAFIYIIHDSLIAQIITDSLFGILIGACLHILEDAICGTIPGFFGKGKCGIKLFEVGSYKEYIFSWIISAGFIGYRLVKEGVA